MGTRERAISTQQRSLVRVMIASPLEAEHVAKIAAAYPEQIEVIYRPDLMPSPRYDADHTGDPKWRRSPGQQAEWRALLAQAEVLWDFPVGEEISPLELSPHLQWLQTTSAGVGDRVKQLSLDESDVIITTASGVHARPLAEFVFAALLSHTKRLRHLQAEQQIHHWERFCTRELHGQTMAIIGFGRIGREIAHIARCFGMTIWVMARDNSPSRAATLDVDQLFNRAELEHMLAGADCLVLCAPHTPETERMLARDELEALKPGAVLINVARGALIDEEALIELLEAGRIGLAALDVFQTEPLPADSLLWKLPNVLVSPHSASTADTENAKLADRFIENLRYFLTGALQHMAPVLDKKRLY